MNSYYYFTPLSLIILAKYLTLSHCLLHNFIFFLIVQLTMDDVSSESFFASLKNELQKYCMVHESDILHRAAMKP